MHFLPYCGCRLHSSCNTHKARQLKTSVVMRKACARSTFQETQKKPPPWKSTEDEDGTPGRSRTYDLRIRSPLLYPAELRALAICEGRCPRPLLIRPVGLDAVRASATPANRPRRRGLRLSPPSDDSTTGELCFVGTPAPPAPLRWLCPGLLRRPVGLDGGSRIGSADYLRESSFGARDFDSRRRPMTPHSQGNCVLSKELGCRGDLLEQFSSEAGKGLRSALWRVTWPQTSWPRMRSTR